MQQPTPIVKDIYGNRWLYNARTNTLTAIDVITVARVGIPLIIKYVVPMVKELIIGLQQSHKK